MSSRWANGRGVVDPLAEVWADHQIHRRLGVAYIGAVAQLLRLLLLVLAGMAGWIAGGIFGFTAGAIADVILGNATASPGATVISHAWGWSILGGIIGGIAGFAWMGWQLGKTNT